MTDEQTHINEIREWSKFADTPMRKASKWALGAIERLRTENADLKNKLERESTEELTRKIADLTILCVDSKREIVRLKRRVNAQLDARLKAAAFMRYDVKKEVIE